MQYKTISAIQKIFGKRELARKIVGEMQGLWKITNVLKILHGLVPLKKNKM